MSDIPDIQMDAKYRALVAILSEENQKLRNENAKLHSKRSEHLKVCITRSLTTGDYIYIDIYYGKPEPNNIFAPIFSNSWHKDEITFEYYPALVRRIYNDSLETIRKRLGFPERTCIRIRIHRVNPQFPITWLFFVNDVSDIYLTYGDETIRLTLKAFVKICNAIMDAKGM